MLLLQLTVIEGLLTETDKRALVAKLTDEVVALAGEHLRAFTWVIIEEVASGNCAIAGQALTTNDVKALAAGALL